VSARDAEGGKSNGRPRRWRFKEHRSEKSPWKEIKPIRRKRYSEKNNIENQDKRDNRRAESNSPRVNIGLWVLFRNYVLETGSHNLRGKGGKEKGEGLEGSHTRPKSRARDADGKTPHWRPNKVNLKGRRGVRTSNGKGRSLTEKNLHE